MVSSGFQMALLHVATALPLGPTGPVNLTTITHCSSKWTEIRIHPCDVLPAANEKQVACLCSVRREEGGGTGSTPPQPNPTFLGQHRVTRPGGAGLLHPDRSLHTQTLGEGMPAAVPVPAPTAALPVTGHWTWPWAWAGGQPEPESLGGDSWV